MARLVCKLGLPGPFRGLSSCCLSDLKRSCGRQSACPLSHWGVLQTPPLVARPPTQPAEEAAALEDPLAEAPIQTMVNAPEDLACAPPAVSVTVNGMPLSAEDLKADDTPAKTADAPMDPTYVSLSADAATYSICMLCNIHA